MWSRRCTDKPTEFYFVEIKVRVDQRNDCDVCDMSALGGIGSVCPYNYHYGSPVFCGGKLSYLVYHIGDIGAGICMIKFKAVNLAHYAKEIKRALTGTKRTSRRKHQNAAN